MSLQLVGPRPSPGPERHPFRRTFVLSEALIGASGLAGTWQLLRGSWTPPLSAIEPLGLHSWRLPGLWLFGTVAVPAGVAGRLAWRRHEQAPTAVLAASGLLVMELVVQIPFLGLHPLQAVYGVPALVLAALALRARAEGWRSGGDRSRPRLSPGRSPRP
jgi:hypothetical protein